MGLDDVTQNRRGKPIGAVSLVHDRYVEKSLAKADMYQN